MARSLRLSIHPSSRQSITAPRPRRRRASAAARRATPAARGGRPIGMQPAPGGDQSEGGKNAGWTLQRGGERGREEARKARWEL